MKKNKPTDGVSYREWLDSRPPEIQEAAKKWPVGTSLVTSYEGETLYVIGWGEEKSGRISVLCSKIDPSIDYDGAVKMENRCRICSDCLALGEVVPIGGHGHE